MANIAKKEEELATRVTLTMDPETKRLSKEVIEASGFSQSGLYRYLLKTYGRVLIDSLKSGGSDGK